MAYAAAVRARINERLLKAVQFPITVIVAPAGFGKTLALRDFLKSARLEVVQLGLRPEDRTLLAFVRGLVETLSPLAPEALAAFPGIQQRAIASAVEPEDLVSWLEEHLRKTVCTIVVDDLHHAASEPATIAFLADLINRTKGRIRWIIATRSDAGLPIATWLGYGAMDLPIDEHDLRFTLEETLAAVEAASIDADAEEIKALHELTDGWAVALAIAVRSRQRPADIRTAARGVRELLYRFIADQAYTRLAPEQRTFLLRTCVFSTFDAETAQAYGGDADFLSNLRLQCGFIFALSETEFRYHDLFREFLETQLRRLGEAKWKGALTSGGDLLEARGDHAAALRLYTRAEDTNAILELISQHGFPLIERGDAEIVAAAIDAVPAQRRNAAALGISAVLTANGGDIEVAEQLFRSAIEAAGDRALQIQLTYRYALELVRHERQCIDLLLPYAHDNDIAPHLHVPILATLATAYIRAGCIDDAVNTMERALAKVNPTVGQDVQARLYQQAAFVYQFSADSERTRRHAERAVEFALGASLYDVAARAYSILYTVVYEESDNPIAVLQILDKLGECARKGGSTQAKIFGLIATYGIEVERGNEPAIEQLRRQLVDSRVMVEGARREALLPAEAMILGWHGEFQKAYELLVDSVDLQSEPDRRAYRSAETAFYSIAAGLQAEGERAVQSALEALNACDQPSQRTVRTRLNLGVAELLRGRSAIAHRHISEAERTVDHSFRRLKTLVHCVRVLYQVQMEQADEGALRVAFERLRSEHMGGTARLFDRVRFPEKQTNAYSLLTNAERSILNLIVLGASSKEVARQTGRSSQTVDTHVRSICRKLRCSGRREAVALAVHSGWVQSV